MAAKAEVLRRFAPRGLRGIASSLLAVVLALLVSMGIIAAFGDPPLAAIRNLWIGAFGSSQQIGGTLSYMTPLLIVALGWILVASVGRISVGFDGQILVGGILATTVGVNLAGLPTALHLPLGILAAIAGGAIWAGVAAWLWAARRVNEIIATLLLNFIAAKIVAWLVRGPLQEPNGSFPQSAPLTDSGKWPHLLTNTPLAGDIFIALLLVAAMPLLLRGTGFGYRLRLTGANDEAAKHAGVNTRRVTVAALVISGALSGLAGSSLILAGQTGVMSDGFNQNLGFYGIVVALLARNSPVGTVPAALLVGALLQGGPFMQAQVGISSALVSLVQGLVVVFVAGSVFLNRRRASRRDGGIGAPARVDDARPVEVP